MATPPAPPPPPHEMALTLTLGLPLPLPLPPAPPLPFALVSPKPHARRPRPDGTFSRVRSSPTGDTPPCTECGKRFPSWKALFGHMRCHPERQWRGITPPPHSRHGGAGPSSAAAGQFTVQEREVAACLLMLSGARPGAAGKGKKSAAASPSPGATSPSAAPGPSNCDDHKCSVCHRGFTSGQALGGHKRCHWEKACMEVVVFAAAGSSGTAISDAPEAAILDLNMPPPGPPLVRKNDQSSSLNEMLDLKLGY